MYTKAIIAADTNSSESGFQGHAFTGTFDGNGHKISNLTVTASTQDYVGLFGYVGSSGQIRNLGVENISVTGNSYVGGLVGSNTCVELSISSLTNCYAAGSVTGNSYVGGLIGLTRGKLTSCYAMASVNGDIDVGGLVGLNNTGTLISCYATGSVAGIDKVGGLVGLNSAVINICYTSLYVTDCYATGSVSGTGYVGGLVGSNVCAAGAVLKLTACFWDVQTSGQTVGVGYGTTTGATGKTTAEMKQQANFISWDFNDIWSICETTNYPKLQWQILTGDIVCPDGVDTFDLAELCGQWLFDEIPADLAPLPAGDGIVNFADFSVFAGQWGITNGTDELLDFTGQWLKTGLPICSADISPLPEGDGRVNAEDFAVMAENWLLGL